MSTYPSQRRASQFMPKKAQSPELCLPGDKQGNGPKLPADDVVWMQISQQKQKGFWVLCIERQLVLYSFFVEQRKRKDMNDENGV